MPPDDGKGHDVVNAPWKMEYDVVHTLRERGPRGARGRGGERARRHPRGDPGDEARHRLQPARVASPRSPTWDLNVVAYLELHAACPTPGCNTRGLLLARDKALAKKILELPPHPGARLRGGAAGPRRAPAAAARASAHRQVAHPRRVDRHLPGLGGRGRREARGAGALHPREHRHAGHRRGVRRGARALRERDRQPPPAGAADLGARLLRAARGGAADRHRAAQVEHELPEEARDHDRPRPGPRGAARARRSASCASASTAA